MASHIYVCVCVFTFKKINFFPYLLSIFFPSSFNRHHHFYFSSKFSPPHTFTSPPPSFFPISHFLPPPSHFFLQHTFTPLPFLSLAHVHPPSHFSFSLLSLSKTPLINPPIQLQLKFLDSLFFQFSQIYRCYYLPHFFSPLTSLFFSLPLLSSLTISLSIRYFLPSLSKILLFS